MKMNYEQFLEENFSGFDSPDITGNPHHSGQRDTATDILLGRNKQNQQSISKEKSEILGTIDLYTKMPSIWKNKLNNNVTELVQIIIPKLFDKGGVKQIQINGVEEISNANFGKKLTNFVVKLKELFTTKTPKFTFKNGVINFDFS